MGTFIPLAMFGEVSVLNDGGLLKLTLPTAAQGWFTNLPEPAYGPIQEKTASHHTVLSAWFRPQPGMFLSIPIGPLGALVLEAVWPCQSRRWFRQRDASRPSPLNGGIRNE